MTAHDIVLGTDSGTFWTGNDSQPWLDDPRKAKVFASPREAWQAASKLQAAQAEYLEGSSVELHIRDPEKPRLTRWVTSLSHANVRPLLRTQWQQGFGEALPPDIPAPAMEPGDISRLEEYLRDVNWDGIRERQTGDPKPAADLGLAASFWESMAQLSKRDQAAAIDLWQKQVPDDFPKSILDGAIRQEPDGTQRPPAETSSAEFELATIANEISRNRNREAVPLRSSSRPQKGIDDVSAANISQPPPLPAFVRRHFVRAGDRFYHRQEPERLAFTDRGEAFRAEDASASVATALVEIAESRGWSAIRVKGSKEFRRLVWTTAMKRGLSVEGYSPSAGERAMLEQEPGPQKIPPDIPRTESRTDGRDRTASPLAGILVDHGAAPYQHEPNNAASYFVSLRGASGDLSAHWGLDLERALAESGAAIGDQVQLARLGKQRVQVREPVRDDAGAIVDYETKETDRNAWSVTVQQRSSQPRIGGDPRDRRRVVGGTDPIAQRVVELFTSERLAQFPPEDRARFRDLYDQAKAQLEAKSLATDVAIPAGNETQRRRNRPRVAQGR